jgi:predicted nucleic-acid-binding Zn-ribbon protein
LEFCPCCDDDVFDEKDVTTCLVTGEINTKMLEIQPNIYKKKGILD